MTLYKPNSAEVGGPGSLRKPGQKAIPSIGMNSGVGPIGKVGILATLFWVGSTGNWSQSSHWARVSGGSGGVGIPLATTAVVFDANSGTAATVTVDTGGLAKSITINKSDLTLLDSVGMTVTGAVTLTAGALNTNGHTENWGLFVSSGTAVRTLTFTNSTINLSASNAVSTITATNMTATLTGSTVNVTGFSSTFVPGTLTFPNVVFSGGGAMTAGNGTYGNLSILGNNSQLFDNVMTTGTWTVTGLFTATGFAQNNRVSFINGPRTITAAAVSLANAEFRQITGAGAATWTGTMLGDNGGNSGITFTTPTTVHWVGNSGNWSDGSHYSLTSGGAATGNVPLPQDTVLFDAGSFTLPGQTVTMNYSEYAGMDWTGVTNNPVLFMFTGGNLCGNIVLSAGMSTLGGTQVTIYPWYKANSTGTITTNGVAWCAGFGVNAPGATFQLLDNFTQGHNSNDVFGLFVNSGTFDANNHNVTMVGQMIATGSTTRSLLMGSGTFTLGYPKSNPWSISAAGMTLNAGTSTIKIAASLTSPVAAGDRTFAGAGLTYNNIEWTAEGLASSRLIFTGANVIGDLKVDADTVARRLTLPASVTTTVTTTELSGSVSALLTVDSSTAGTQATLSQATGSVAGTFLSLKDSNATGGATFTAQFSVNAGNNLGWTITALLPIWSAAKTAVASGSRNAKLMFIGDSMTMGAFGNGPANTFLGCRPFSYPMQLIPSVANTLDQSWGGSCSVTTNTYQQYDSRITSSTNWSNIGGSPTLGAHLYNNTTTADPLIFSPPIAFDTIDVWTPQLAGIGTLLVNVDGGATLATIVEAGSNLYKKTTISCPLGIHTLQFVRSSGNCYISAFSCYNSTQKVINVFNSGWSGSKVSDWIDSTLVYSPLNALIAHAADCYIYADGANEWANAINTTTFQTNLQTLITTITSTVGADMILMSDPPSDISIASVAVQKQYRDIMQALALSNNIPYIDYTAIFGSYATGNANGYYANTVHLNGTGYGIMKNAPLALLLAA